MKPVIIYRETLLPKSETFIKNQVESLKVFQPYYAGLARVKQGLALTSAPVVLTSAGPPMSGLFRKWYKLTNFAPGFHQRVARSGPKLLHAHFAPDAVAALPLCATLKIPLVVTLHGYDVTVQRDFARTYGKLWRRAHLFLCVSEFIRQKAIEAGFPSEKLTVHYIGVDCEKFKASSDPKTDDIILFVGRLVEKKGCEDLIRAAAIVQRRRPGAELVIIGEGPLKEDLRLLAEQMSVSCKFLGAQPAGEVRRWVQRSAVLCAPSKTAANGDSEGLPTVILEAQAMSVPVVSTFHAGIPEGVIDGETALLAREGDIPSIAAHLLRFLEDTEYCKTAGRKGREWITKEFNLVRQTEKLEQVYEAVSNRGIIQ